jgi:hypothetical protein
MNEKIKELIEQCTVQEFSDCTGGFETFDKEKFALLIVRECMRMCDCADSSYLEHGCDKEASGAAGAKQFIKEWFEVEE